MPDHAKARRTPGAAAFLGAGNAAAKFHIRVVFHAGVAVLLEYTRVNGQLTLQDANVLLAANTNDATWDPGKQNTETNRFYRRSDGKAVAHYATEYDGSLLIAAENTGGDLFGDRLLDGR